MKPLILQFAENPAKTGENPPETEYSGEQNLNVVKGTDVPAVPKGLLDTKTRTEAKEVTDED